MPPCRPARAGHTPPRAIRSLVHGATGAAWTPLFGRAAHASLVAREYGIPAVVGTGSRGQGCDAQASRRASGYGGRRRRDRRAGQSSGRSPSLKPLLKSLPGRPADGSHLSSS
jgi:hypothetical protein